MRFFVNILLFYLLQSVTLSKINFQFFPNILLILLAVQVAAKGFSGGFYYGLLVGLVKNILMSFSFMNIFLFAIIGGILGLIPAQYFLNRRLLVIFNYLVVTLLYFFVRYFHIYSLLNRFSKVSIPGFCAEIFIGLTCIYLFYPQFNKLLGIKVNDK